jgi:hypothetical protein
VAKRACVFGAGVHVGQARDFVFVEFAPCPCGQPLSYAVPLVCGGLFELHPCSFAVSWAVMSANLATRSCTTGLCSQNPPITAELMPPMRRAGVCMGGGTTPANTSVSMAAGGGGGARAETHVCTSQSKQGLATTGSSANPASRCQLRHLVMGVFDTMAQIR